MLDRCNMDFKNARKLTGLLPKRLLLDASLPLATLCAKLSAADTDARRDDDSSGTAAVTMYSIGSTFSTLGGGWPDGWDA